MTQKLLDLTGIGSDRLHLAWVSSAEAQRFVQIVTDATDAVRALGRFDPEAFKLQLAAAEQTVVGETVRWLVGKETTITTKGDIYGRKWDESSFESILNTALEREYHMELIRAAINDGQTAPRTIDAEVGIGVKRISYLLADMEKRGMVEFKHMEAHKPVFGAL